VDLLTIATRLLSLPCAWRTGKIGKHRLSPSRSHSVTSIIGFIPTNNDYPWPEPKPALFAEARDGPSKAIENRLWVARADVAGKFGKLMSLGFSAIVDPNGNVIQEGRAGSEYLLVGEMSLKSALRH
jgi:carbon-nitrogen hydrolase